MSDPTRPPSLLSRFVAFLNRPIGRAPAPSSRQGGDRAPIVEFNDTEIWCSRPSGLVERVAWDDLQAVILKNTDDGPFACDIFWVLVGKKSGCVVPTDSKGASALFTRLQQLPGFDNEAAIASMSCTENKDFLCWRREGRRSAHDSEWSCTW